VPGLVEYRETKEGKVPSDQQDRMDRQGAQDLRVSPDLTARQAPRGLPDNRDPTVPQATPALPFPVGREVPGNKAPRAPRGRAATRDLRGNRGLAGPTGTQVRRDSQARLGR